MLGSLAHITGLCLISTDPGINSLTLRSRSQNEGSLRGVFRVPGQPADGQRFVMQVLAKKSFDHFLPEIQINR